MKNGFFLFLTLFFTTVAGAAECQIPGVEDAPQALHCKYRDGWYIPHYLDLNCKEGSYHYVLSTRQGEYENGTASAMRDPSTGEFRWSNRDGIILSVQKRSLGRFTGTRVFPGWESENENVHCRVIR